ncbi:hypothetical protein VTK26DRAFT_7077 [Humicola hyalothermophila]
MGYGDDDKYRSSGGYRYSRRTSPFRGRSPSPVKKYSWERKRSPSPKKYSWEKKPSTSPKKYSWQRSQSPSPKGYFWEKKRSSSPTKKYSSRQRTPSPKGYFWEKNRASSPANKYSSGARARTPSPKGYFWEKKNRTRSPAASPRPSGSGTSKLGSPTPLYETDREAKYSIYGRDVVVRGPDDELWATCRRTDDGKRHWVVHDAERVGCKRNENGDIEFWSKNAK